jgi:muramoyltetrapeptide carboxypeptidase LdcA involved in peptidoglycan recycling
MKYQDLKIEYSGIAPQGVPVYTYDEMQSKIGVSVLPFEAKTKFGINFTPDDDTTRFEAALLHFYQSKFITNTTKVIIVWKPVMKLKDEIIEFKRFDPVLMNFASNIDIPVLKSEAFGYKSLNNFMSRFV